MDANGIHNTVPVDGITSAKRAKKGMPAAEEEGHENVQDNETNTSSDKYVVERMVRHRDNDNETRYLERSYGYRHADDPRGRPTPSSDSLLCVAGDVSSIGEHKNESRELSEGERSQIVGKQKQKVDCND